MARFEALNHYELLEVAVSASSFEIRQAYRDALSIYEEGSVISSSFFNDEERNHILNRIEEAFSTLIDDGKRARYNRELVTSGQIDSKTLDSSNQKPKGPVPLFSLKKTRGWQREVATLKTRVEKNEFSEIRKEINAKPLICGRDLRDFRRKLGIAIEEIFEETRISTNVLEAIERDDLKSLPPGFYIKNFIKAYAQFLKLDSKSVVDGYLKNFARLKKFK